ncbi:MAG TPA: alpha/beta fold hydrolase [Gemmataceae bacterium]|nr:alpha/beta fold hydrolase [Gemmataceae bacterium]
MPRCRDATRIGLLVVSWCCLGQLAAQPPGELVKRSKAASSTPAVIDTRFVQVRPAPKEEFALARSQGQARAVVLVHGLRLHPFSADNVNKAGLQDWQKTGSVLVRLLAKYADVYAFAYSENVPLDAVADTPPLDISIWRLKQLGYREIVLIGHSAGGVIVREYVEDHPQSSVTKVIEVCAPNEGSGFARLDAPVRKGQRPFLASLTHEARAAIEKQRLGKRIPPGLQFVCVVGDGAGAGDGLVANTSQWPDDLQAQGIPAVALRTTHFTVMRNKSEAERLAELVRQPQPRWSPAKVAAVRKILCHK